MSTANKPTPGQIPPVVYTNEELERRAARKRRAEEKKQAERAAEERLRTSADYPLKALGNLMNPALSISLKVRCSPVIAANSLLAVVSLAAQSVGDVLLPFGQTRPLSLFFLTVAGSGDRKSSADTEAMAPVRMREAEIRKVYAEKLSAFMRKLAAWTAERDRILKSKVALSDKEEALKALGDKPPAPRRPVLTMDEATQEGIIKAFDTLPPALGLFSPEGGQFLGGHGFTAEKKVASAGAFSNLWDGRPVRRARAGEGITDLRDRRLAVHMLVQPEIAKTFLADPVLRDQGMIARFLVSRPESLIGERPWADVDGWPDARLGVYGLYMERLFQASKTKDDDGAELDLTILKINDAAKSAWTSFHDEVEAGMKPGAPYAGLHDVASKTAEQAARIAGVLTLFENPSAKEIDLPDMERGCVLARWYLDEAARLMETASISEAVADGNDLIAWILTRPEDDAGGRTVSRRQMQQLGPTRLRRDEKRREAAIDSLVSANLAHRPGNAKGGTLFVARPSTK